MVSTFVLIKHSIVLLYLVDISESTVSKHVFGWKVLRGNGYCGQIEQREVKIFLSNIVIISFNVPYVKKKVQEKKYKELGQKFTI